MQHSHSLIFSTDLNLFMRIEMTLLVCINLSKLFNTVFNRIKILQEYLVCIYPALPYMHELKACVILSGCNLQCAVIGGYWK